MEGVGSLNLKNILTSAFFGAFMTVTGFVVLGFMGQFVELACERTHVVQVHCVKTTAIWGVIISDVQTIEKLERAWVHEKCDDGCSYRVHLKTARGNIPLSSFRSDYSSKYKMADQINTFVNDLTKPSFVIKTNAGLPAILFPVIFILAGPLIAIEAMREAAR
jgi:hypothetical protein